MQDADRISGDLVHVQWKRLNNFLEQHFTQLSHIFNSHLVILLSEYMLSHGVSHVLSSFSPTGCNTKHQYVNMPTGHIQFNTPPLTARTALQKISTVQTY